MTEVAVSSAETQSDSITHILSATALMLAGRILPGCRSWPRFLRTSAGINLILHS